MKRPWQYFHDRCRACSVSPFLANLPPQSARVAFDFLSPSTRREYSEVAWDGVASYLYYFEIMAGEHKPDLWSGLSESERDDFLPYDVTGFLQCQVGKVAQLKTEFRFEVQESACDVESAPSRARHVLKVLCEKHPSVLRDSLDALRAFFGVEQQDVKHELKQQLKREQGVKEETPPSELSLDACKDIEAALVRPYVQLNLQYGEKSHWGSLLHYLVWLAGDHFGETWPRKVIIANSSTLDLVDVMKLQSTALGMGVVLCTDTHWSLLCVRMGSAAAYLYDGLGCRKTWDLAEAVMWHVRQRQQTVATVVRGDFPRQDDSWSCGHRVVLAFQHFLSSFEDSVWPPRMPPADFSLEAIQEFCEDEGLDELALDKEEPLSKKPRLGHSNTAGPSKPLVPADERSDAAEASKSLVPAQDATADGISRPQKRRKLSQKQLDLQDCQKGRDLMAAKKMSYEKHFQSAHHAEKQPMLKGHWKDFLLALVRDKRLACKTCCTLRDMVLLPDSPQERQQLAVPEQPSYSGKGRPPKGVSGKLLQSYLAEKSPGVYTHVRGNWYFCEWCQVEVNFHRPGLSGLAYVQGHEKCKKHKDPALPKALVPLSTKDCEGARGLRVV